MKKLLAAVVLLIIIPIKVHADSDWDFRLTPYIWFAGVEGDVSTIPGGPSVPLDISASDVLSDTEASFMVLFEAKKQKHGLLIDILYSKVESDDELVPEINLNLKSISRSKIFTAAYSYEIYKKEQTVVDVFGGARYWDVDMTLAFGGGLGLLAGRTLEIKDSWVDPLIGIKARTPLGNSKFYTAGALLVGGFGIGSDSFYDVAANIGYQWSKTIGTTLGYRLFDVDYDKDSFKYNAKQEGWQIALSWAF